MFRVEEKTWFCASCGTLHTSSKTIQCFDVECKACGWKWLKTEKPADKCPNPKCTDASQRVKAFGDDDFKSKLRAYNAIQEAVVAEIPVSSVLNGFGSPQCPNLLKTGVCNSTRLIDVTNYLPGYLQKESRLKQTIRELDLTGFWKTQYAKSNRANVEDQTTIKRALSEYLRDTGVFKKLGFTARDVEFWEFREGINHSPPNGF